MFSALSTSLGQQLVEVGAAVQLAVGDDGVDLSGIGDVLQWIGFEQDEVG